MTPPHTSALLQPSTALITTSLHSLSTDLVSVWPHEVEGVTRVYAILDNLNVHRATDGLLFSLAYPRCEFVFIPKYKAYLNMIEPWWKALRSLALKGRRFETWARWSLL